MTEQKPYKFDSERYAKQSIIFLSNKTDEYAKSHGLGDRKEQIAQAKEYLRTGTWPENAQ